MVDNKLSKVAIAPRKEPPKFDAIFSSSDDITASERILTLWEAIRIMSNCDKQQVIPRFVGWVVLMFGNKESARTMLSFLPPIRNPITAYSSVLECIVRSQRLSLRSNVKYVYTNVDAGAAAKFFPRNLELS